MCAAMAIPPQTAAPDFELEDLDGKRIVLTEVLTLYPVLMVFFRSDCELCQWALPQLARFESFFKGQDIEVYYVTPDHPQVADDTIRALRLDYLHVLVDPDGKVAKEYGVDQLPALVLIGPDGTVINSTEGWEPEALVVIGRQVKELVAGIRGPLFGGSWRGEPCPAR